jgi:hypothetical protein
LYQVEDVDGVYQFIYLLKRKELYSTSDIEVLVSEEKVPVKGNSKPAVQTREPAPKPYTPRPKPRDTQPAAGV